jgi:hypothetical protein
MKGFVPYIPTPSWAVARAEQLLPTLDIDAIQDDPGPDGETVRYRGEWHPPSSGNPETHKGVSVYHRPAVWW